MFQTFPFLEQARQAFLSARAWVHEDLKPIEGAAPVTLESKVEERLASEIDTDRARVVQGDGSDSWSKKDELCPPEKAGVRITPAEGHTESEAGSVSQDEEPSWVTPSPWPSPPLSPDEEDIGIDRQREPLPRRDTARSTASSSSNAATRSRASSITSSSFWRLSSIPSPALQPSSPTISIRRVRSRPYLKVDTASHPPSREYRLPAAASAATLSPTVNEPVPGPSIRRSHSSHPDITSLCDQWAHNGPANQTLTYKPDCPPKRRKHSSSVSSVISMTTRGAGKAC